MTIFCSQQITSTSKHWMHEKPQHLGYLDCNVYPKRHNRQCQADMLVWPSGHEPSSQAENEIVSVCLCGQPHELVSVCLCAQPHEIVSVWLCAQPQEVVSVCLCAHSNEEQQRIPKQCSKIVRAQ